jgi:drug/metabolite transporter (DMT)-like permease
MIGLALISTVVASMTFFLGLRHLGPASAALVATSEVVLGLMWVVLFLGDSLKVIQVLGAILVIIGVVWSQRVIPQTKTPEPTKA